MVHRLYENAQPVTGCRCPKSDLRTVCNRPLIIDNLSYSTYSPDFDVFEHKEYLH